MRVLLDTHYLVWLVGEPEELSVAEGELLTGTEHEMIVSTLSIWELRINMRANERRRVDLFPFTVADAIDFCRDNDLPIVSPQNLDYAVPLIPALDHTDPFDEMLLVHAQQLRARLMTRDGRLRDHPLALAL